jgi:CBS domain-containing protein
MNVEKLMTPNVRSACETQSLADAAQLMWEGDCGCLPVVSADESNRVVGMITDRDICMATHFRGTGPSEIAIRDIMSTGVRTIGPAETLADAEAIMRDSQVRRLPVVDAEQRLLGMISLADLARRADGNSTLAGVTQRDVSETLKRISAPRCSALAPAIAS